MTQLMQSVIDRLQRLPESEQEQVAARIDDYLTRLKQVRAMVAEAQEDVSRGYIVPFDAEDITLRGQARLAARKTAE
jgi:hypothetical protein